MTKVAPSILSADFGKIESELKKLEYWGAAMVHCDVMDGHFVPNLSLGPEMIKAMRTYTDLELDVHLMIEQPEAYIESFAKAGADVITVHYEACVHLHRVIGMIREQGKRVGVAINPATNIALLENILTEIDLVLIMTVNPGFGGQKFIPGMLDKIAALRMMIDDRGLDVAIEVDGGINTDNSGGIVEAGADILVSGSAIFGNSNPAKALNQIAQGGLERGVEYMLQ